MVKNYLPYKIFDWKWNPTLFQKKIHFGGDQIRMHYVSFYFDWKARNLFFAFLLKPRYLVWDDPSAMPDIDP